MLCNTCHYAYYGVPVPYPDERRRALRRVRAGHRV